MKENKYTYYEIFLYLCCTILNFENLDYNLDYNIYNNKIVRLFTICDIIYTIRAKYVIYIGTDPRKDVERRYRSGLN